MYLWLIVLLACINYGLMLYFFPLFFGIRRKWQHSFSYHSVILICVYGAIVHVGTALISDPILQNRALHVFGGGVLALLICYLAERDTRLPISAFQFIVISFLIAIALGVANEILEFVLQNYLGILAAESINDTWLDLISNVIGSGFAVAFLAPLIRKNRR